MSFKQYPVFNCFAKIIMFVCPIVSELAFMDVVILVSLKFTLIKNDSITALSLFKNEENW